MFEDNSQSIQTREAETEKTWHNLLNDSDIKNCFYFKNLDLNNHSKYENIDISQHIINLCNNLHFNALNQAGFGDKKTENFNRITRVCTYLLLLPPFFLVCVFLFALWFVDSAYNTCKVVCIVFLYFGFLFFCVWEIQKIGIVKSCIIVF